MIHDNRKLLPYQQRPPPRCSACGEEGHRRPTCPRRLQTVEVRSVEEAAPDQKLIVAFGLAARSIEALSLPDRRKALRALLALYDEPEEALP